LSTCEHETGPKITLQLKEKKEKKKRIKKEKGTKLSKNVFYCIFLELVKKLKNTTEFDTLKLGRGIRGDKNDI